MGPFYFEAYDSNGESQPDDSIFAYRDIDDYDYEMGGVFPLDDDRLGDIYI